MIEYSDGVVSGWPSQHWPKIENKISLEPGARFESVSFKPTDEWWIWIFDVICRKVDLNTQNECCSFIIMESLDS